MAKRKWMQAESRRQERAGTKGTLKAKDPTPSTPLTEADLSALERKARATKKGKNGRMTKAGLKLFHKVQFARRAREAHK